MGAAVKLVLRGVDCDYTCRGDVQRVVRAGLRAQGECRTAAGYRELVHAGRDGDGGEAAGGRGFPIQLKMRREAANYKIRGGCAV